MSSMMLLLSLMATACSALPSMSNQVVRASTGFYTGKINDQYDTVREFLNVPFGVSTAGQNRFMPPLPVPLSSEHFDATSFAEACPQYVGTPPTIWNQEIPQYLQYWGAANNSAGVSAPFTSEDCLRLAIWTPANATASSNLPVALFWTGGGFQTNGILVPGQLPQRWIARSQSHIVVTINYRMNIMGFPNAAGIRAQNLGLLDQRLSLEWVRDNIRSFGGDPSKIMIWGQSAGAASVDYHNYAYWDDPIAHAVFAQSGSVFLYQAGSADLDWTHTNFTFVAKGVGCDFPDNGTAELECMQKVPYHDVINFMGRYNDNGSTNPDQPGLSFNTIADERIVFADYPDRYKSGFVSNIPAIYSSAANEGASLVEYPVDNLVQGPNQTEVNTSTQRFLCGAANSSILRDDIGLITYRYQYAGNWTNQDPFNWTGAYHSSDLVMLFGTYADDVGPVAEPLEQTTSQAMEDYVLAFMRDPYNGPHALGWPVFNASADDGGTMLRFGANGKPAQNVSVNSVQGVCFGNGPYDPFP